MESRLDGLESQVREIGTVVRDLRRRVADLESDRSPEELLQLGPSEELRSASGDWLRSAVPIFGGSLLLLGGAYLLRALTELESVPNTLGLSLGYSYAIALLLAADRSAARAEGRVAAGFYSVVGAIVAFPLVLEAVTRFHLIGALGASLAVGLASVGLVAVAVRRRLGTAAAAASIGGGASLLALLRSVEDPTPVLAVLLLLGLAMVWLYDREGWSIWRWSSALFADLGFAVLPAGLAAGRFSTDPTVATVALVALFAAYAGVFSVRCLREEERIGVFAISQTLVAGLISFGGGWTIRGSNDWLLGAVALVLGTIAYVLAFSVISRQRRHGFFFLSSLGLALVGIGALRLLSADQAALVCLALGTVCAFFSGRYGRVTLSLHSTLFLLAALFASGLARAATAGYWNPDPAAWPQIRPIHAVVIAALGIALVVPVARRSDAWGRLALVPRAGLLLFFVWAAGGALLGLLVPRYLGGADGLDAGALATSRTGLLAVSALLLAWLSCRPRFSEAGWLVYPLLAVACLRVLSQDLFQGRPVTLFVSMVLLGASLIASSRWLRREESALPSGAGSVAANLSDLERQGDKQEDHEDQ